MGLVLRKLASVSKEMLIYASFPTDFLLASYSKEFKFSRKIRIYLQRSNAYVRKLSAILPFITSMQFPKTCFLHMNNTPALVFFLFFILSIDFDFPLDIFAVAVIFVVILLYLYKPPQILFVMNLVIDRWIYIIIIIAAYNSYSTVLWGAKWPAEQVWTKPETLFQ